MMNNWAFAFNISVPVHIILRSFGSVTTMAAGWMRGKKYTRVQIFSVAVLTLGVMVSAWADAKSKVSLYVQTYDAAKYYRAKR
jgi:dolichyl-phosphate-mannose-protein mannosyltransferase